MKSMKKILSAILTIALLASFFGMPVHAVSQDAQTCAAIDVLRGDGSGVTDVYLAKNTNRSQGAKILLRLMGLEADADVYGGTATFTDASNASEYWQPMLRYLKANPEVGFNGYPDGTFQPNKIMTAQEIYKVLLVSLGYVENVDFTWGEVFTSAMYNNRYSWVRRQYFFQFMQSMIIGSYGDLRKLKLLAKKEPEKSEILRKNVKILKLRFEQCL